MTTTLEGRGDFGFADSFIFGLPAAHNNRYTGPSMATAIHLGERACYCHAGIMAELESTAWKDDRRFRIITLDAGTFSFADLHFQTPSKPRTPAIHPQGPYSPSGHNVSITGADLSRAVGKHLVLVTSPPDGRYPARRGGPEVLEGGGEVTVRALILPAWSGVPADVEKVGCVASRVPVE